MHILSIFWQLLQQPSDTFNSTEEASKVDTKYKRYIYAALLVAGTLIWTVFVWQYKKFDDSWLGVNIFIWALVLSAIIGFGFTRLRWWQERYGISNGWIYGILFIGLLICLIAGTYMTEPIYNQMSQAQLDAYNRGEYDYSTTRAGVWYFLYFGSGNASTSNTSNTSDTSSGSSIDIDDGEGLAILLLIIMVLVLIFASVLIPHAWVVAGAILLTLTALAVYRDFKAEEKSSYW